MVDSVRGAVTCQRCRRAVGALHECGRCHKQICQTCSYSWTAVDYTFWTRHAHTEEDVRHWVMNGIAIALVAIGFSGGFVKPLLWGLCLVAWWISKAANPPDSSR